MTFSGMGESEMAPEADNGEAQETGESSEVEEMAVPLDQVTFETEETIATTGSYLEAEVVETGFTEVMQAAVTETTAPIVEVDDGMSGSPEPIDDRSGDKPVAQPGGPSPSDGGDVMIDTVPLPEKPMELGAREKIGTWPTPEEPVRMEGSVPSDIVDRVAIIDTNDGSMVAERKLDDVSIIDSNDGSMIPERNEPVLDTDFDSPPPPPPMDSNNMEIPEGMRDELIGSRDSGLEMQKTMEVPGETSDVLQSVGAADEGSRGERTLEYDGGEGDKFDPGVEQKFDLHQENRIKDGYGSVAGTGGKEVSGEYQGGEVGIDDPRLAGDGDSFENFVDENGLPINPERGAGGEWNPMETEEEMNKMDGPLGDVMGVMGEGNRPDPANLAAGHGLVTGPQFGIDGTDLQGAASPGADQRAAGVLADIASALNTLFGGGGGGGGDDTAKQAEVEELEAEGEAEEAANEMDEDFGNEYDASKDGTVYGDSSKPGKRDVDVKLTAGRIWGRATDLFGGGASGDVDPKGDGHAGVRTPDPDGAVYDSGYVEKYKAPPKDSELVEALKDQIIPEKNKPLDPVESMSQPVDEGDPGGEQPVNLKESLDASLDANINWGDDSSGGLSKEKKVNPSEFDADEKLTPPGGWDGEGGVEKPPK